MLQGYLDLHPELHERGVITSYAGFSYNLLEFTPEMVNKSFIIESLSKIHRYNGQYESVEGYSVAQHCVMMAESILLVTGDPNQAREALWHDGSEAYTGDMVRPLKHILGDAFSEIETTIEKAISDVLDIRYPYSPIVKEVDMNICQYEITFLLNPPSQETKMRVWTVLEAKNEFTKMENRLLELIKIKEKING